MFWYCLFIETCNFTSEFTTKIFFPCIDKQIWILWQVSSYVNLHYVLNLIHINVTSIIQDISSEHVLIRPSIIDGKQNGICASHANGQWFGTNVLSLQKKNRDKVKLLLKASVFEDMSRCSLVDIYRHFRWMSFLCIHDGRVHHMARSLEGNGTGGNGMTLVASQWDTMG